MKLQHMLVAVLGVSAGLIGAACADALTEKQKAAVMTAVRDELKDPDSAQFKWLDIPAALKAESGTLPYCVLVNAKNSYGGYVGFKPMQIILYTKPDGSAVAIVMNPPSDDPEIVESVNSELCSKKGYKL